MKPNRKTLVTAITFLLIGIIATSVVWVFAQPSTPFTISTGIYPSASTFTLSLDGSNFYVKDAYGAIPSWGEDTNGSNLFRNMVDAIPTRGGKITIDTGTFTPMDTRIPLKNNLIIEGAGSGSGASPQEGTVLYNTADDFLFILDGLTGVVLRDFKTVGYYSTYPSILLNNSDKCTLENLVLWGTGSLDSSSPREPHGIWIENTHSCNFYDNEFSTNDGWGVYISYSTDAPTYRGSNANNFLRNKIQWNQIGGIYEHRGTENRFSYNTIEGNNDGTNGIGILIGELGNGDSNTYQIEISSNYFEQHRDADIIVNSSGTSDYHMGMTIENNYGIGIAGACDYFLDLQSGYGTKVAFNRAHDYGVNSARFGVNATHTISYGNDFEQGIDDNDPSSTGYSLLFMPNATFLWGAYGITSDVTWFGTSNVTSATSGAVQRLLLNVRIRINVNGSVNSQVGAYVRGFAVRNDHPPALIIWNAEVGINMWKSAHIITDVNQNQEIEIQINFTGAGWDIDVEFWIDGYWEE